MPANISEFDRRRLTELAFSLSHIEGQILLLQGQYLDLSSSGEDLIAVSCKLSSTIESLLDILVPQ